jgi:hypothetical protein
MAEAAQRVTRRSMPSIGPGDLRDGPQDQHKPLLLYRPPRAVQDTLHSIIGCILYLQYTALAGAAQVP